MIPDRGAQLGGSGDPELGAAAERDGVVVEHGRDDEGPVEDGREEEGVPELGQLVAEAAVGRVP